MNSTPIGALRVLARRESRSFTRFGGKLTDAGPVEAGTLVTVEDIDGDVAYIRTADGRRLHVMLSNLARNPRSEAATVSTQLDIGMIVYDRWTRQLVTVVAGAQAEGCVTVMFDGGPVVSIRREHLAGYRIQS